MISRTDSIGDVVLTLPLAGALKETYPDCEIIFLGRDYTRDVVALSSFVDEFVSWDAVDGLSDEETADWLKDLNIDTIIHVFPVFKIAKLSKAAGIKYRIGASGRFYHYLFCNKIVPLSRRNSNDHEAQLNFKLLKPIAGNIAIPAFDHLINYYGFQGKVNSIKKKEKLIDEKRFNLILHPKSRGSAREWPEDHYSQLVDLLPKEKFNIFITGTKEEGKLLKRFLEKNTTKVTDLTGKFKLDEFISFISQCDGLIAASTGPLHIAAAMGKLVIGIYPPIRPMHPGRWGPIGKNAHFTVADIKCNDCRKSLNCRCMSKITPEQIKNKLLENG